MKRVIACVLIGLLGLTVSGCSQQTDLPSEIGEVGGELVKEEDLLETTNPEYSENESSEEEDVLPDSGSCVSDMTSDFATVDDIKSWISSKVTGEYTSTVAETENETSIESTTLQTGEKVDILFYGDVYFMTELYLNTSEDISTLTEKTSSFLAAYIGRRMTEQETSDLKTALTTAVTSGDMGFVESLQSSATVYTMQQDGKLLVQIR